jgi:chromosome segregation ATPase
MTTAQEKIQAFESFKKLGALLPGLFATLEEWAQIGSVQEEADRETAGIARRVAAANSLEAQSKLERDEAHRREMEARHGELADISRKLDLEKAAASRELEAFTASRERMSAMAAAQVDKATERLAELKAEHADWLSKIAAAKDQHANVTGMLADTIAQHQTVQAVIAEAKAKLGYIS